MPTSFHAFPLDYQGAFFSSEGDSPLGINQKFRLSKLLFLSWASRGVLESKKMDHGQFFLLEFLYKNLTPL